MIKIAKCNKKTIQLYIYASKHFYSICAQTFFSRAILNKLRLTSVDERDVLLLCVKHTAHIHSCICCLLPFSSSTATLFLRNTEGRQLLPSHILLEYTREALHFAIAMLSQYTLRVRLMNKSNHSGKRKMNASLNIENTLSFASINIAFFLEPKCGTGLLVLGNE